MSNQRNPESDATDIQHRYDELFAAAVAAAREAGWGVPKTHDDLVAALQNMAIPSSTS